VEPLEKLYQTWTLLYLHARNDLLDIVGYVYVLFAVMVDHALWLWPVFISAFKLIRAC
jgi:hypothetical protein